MGPQEEIEMLAPSANRVLAHALQAGLFGWALSLALIAQAHAAESLPASVRACTAETDRERRLDCFDREVARFPDARSTSRTGNTQPAAPGAPTLAAGSGASVAPDSPGAPSTPAAPSAPATQPPANAPAPKAGKPGRIVASLASIDRSANEMVLHLDNGEIWEEEQSVAGDLSLKAGDHITIEKRMGSYWLTGPHVSGMKVRQRN